MKMVMVKYLFINNIKISFDEFKIMMEKFTTSGENEFALKLSEQEKPEEDQEIPKDEIQNEKSKNEINDDKSDTKALF